MADDEPYSLQISSERSASLTTSDATLTRGTHTTTATLAEHAGDSQSIGSYDSIWGTVTAYQILKGLDDL